MHFQNVVVDAISATLPEEVWTSESIEQQLGPLYSRLKLPIGRLALLSGIEERRVWPCGTSPSGPSIRSGRAALDAASIHPSQVGCLIHASVCRDFLEPATASRVHDGLGLPEDCWVYDVSNACLGLLNGIVQIASLIEIGAIEAGLVVGTENSRMLLEQTIAQLNGDPALTRKTIKPAFASLTIGSGSCAFVLAHRDLVPHGSRLHTAVAKARTAYHDLCRSHQDAAGADMTPLMDTDSEQLLVEGIRTGAEAFTQFSAATGWSAAQVDRSVCHQVGAKHRSLMLEAMGLEPSRDIATFSWLGNTGSVALPLTLAAAAHGEDIVSGHRVGLFGIGSGINSVMLGVDWQQTCVVGNFPKTLPDGGGLVSPPESAAAGQN